MSTIITPARARTDADPRQAPVSATVAPTTGLRITGIAITALAGVNTAFLAIFAGNWDDPFARTMTELAGLALQLALILLLLTMWRTRAVGSGVVWRGAGAITTALAMTAVAASIARMIMPESDAALAILNWSMLLALAGLYVVSLGVVAAGAWRGLLRYLPMALSSWGVLAVIAMMIGDGDAAWWMLMYHLSIGTVLNGLALASRPDLARPRD